MSKNCVDRNRIYVALLAAGDSKRFGSPKQLALIDGETMVQRTARIANAIGGQRSLLIAGREWRAVTKSAAAHCPFFAVNEYPADGIGSSIAMASRMLDTRADAILILLVDQVMITTEHLDTLINAWSGDPCEIVATAFSGTVGPPILFASETFESLSRLNGDKGARSLLEDPRFNTIRVPFADAAFDIDTVTDIKRLC